jgi:hypothetical protein
MTLSFEEFEDTAELNGGVPQPAEYCLTSGGVPQPAEYCLTSAESLSRLCVGSLLQLVTLCYKSM